MNKKLLTLLGLMLGLGVAFGALVQIISNTIKYSFQSELPFELVITSPADCVNQTTCELETVYGGSTVELGFNVTNRANNNLEGTYKIEIIPTRQALDCNEISSVKLIDLENSGQDITDTCVEEDKAVYFNTTETIIKESTVEKTLEITFNKTLHEDNYTIAISILP